MKVMKVRRTNVPYVLTLALSMTGCEFIGPQIHTKLPLPEVDKIKEEQAVPQDLNPDPAKKTTKVEIFPGSDESNIVQQSHAVTGDKSAGGGKGEFSLNFDDADLGEVAKVILSDILGKNYTISPQVTGKVTLQTTKPLTKDELMPTLDMLLSINNAALVNQGGMYLIKPSAEALYNSSVKAFGGSASMPAGYQTRIIPVRNVAAGEIAEILKPLLPEKSLLHVDPNRNILLVAGSGSELSRAIDLVNTFDIDLLKGRSFAMFTPAYVTAGKLIEELDQIFNNGAKKDKDNDGGFIRFIEIERMNSVLAVTHQPGKLKDIETWVLRLDKANNAAASGVNVYKAQHVHAADLANTLNSIYGNSMGSSRSASIASGRRSTSSSNKRSGSSSSGGGMSGSTTGGMSSGGLAGGGTSGSSGGGLGGGSGLGGNRSSGGFADNSLGGTGLSGSGNSGLGGSTGGSGGSNNSGVRIIPDEGNNALIIVANAQEYAIIQRLLKQLDVLPMQVMIDATIVEVKLTDDLQYGIEWFLKHDNGGNNFISGGGDKGLDLSKIATGVATGGFSYAFSSGSKDIAAVLKASALNNNLNILSSPSLMVLNNQEATIKVGDSVPIRSSLSNNLTASGVTGTTIQTSSIQMLDTGVNLSVRPRVNAGGLVLMDILQSVNEATATTTSANIDSPTIQKREIETSVAVQTGETIVLGGLIKEKSNNDTFGVPLLHEIPLLGSLFGSTTRHTEKNELVILLTPRVMKSRQDAQDVTEEFKRKLTGIYYDEPKFTETIEETVIPN